MTKTKKNQIDTPSTTQTKAETEMGLTPYYLNLKPKNIEAALKYKTHCDLAHHTTPDNPPITLLRKPKVQTSLSINNHPTLNIKDKISKPYHLFPQPPTLLFTTTKYYPLQKPNQTNFTMPTSSGANKRARADDNDSNVAKKKAVFDPKESADTPKPGGKKMTAAQRRNGG